MEGGNVNNIDLESGLDIKSSDMLTSVAQPKFQHNWQQFQGKCLPNSLRFEKNGWAAGWNVYNFDYNTYREEQNGYYVGAGQFNTYVKTLNIFASEAAYNPLYTVYVVPDSVVTVGDISISGNIITGTVGNRTFTLTWDPVAHTLSCADNTFELEYSIKSDYAVAFTVKDLTNSFSFDFNIYIGSSLTGDAISSIKYNGYSDSEHKWGSYTYNVNTGKVTTPDGQSITPTVSGNQLSFNYTQQLSEAINLTLTLQEYYIRFDDLYAQDVINEDKLLIDNGTPTISEAMKFNYYTATVDPDDIIGEDEDGVVLDWKLPVWAHAALTVDFSETGAKRPDNTSNYEIATMCGTGINMGATVKNIFDGEHNVTIEDSYRSSYPKYLSTGEFQYRFNQILLNNTIEPSSSWQPYKVTINKEVWFLDSRCYTNLRNKKTTLMTQYLGDVYTWGSFTVNANNYLKYNSVYSWLDANNCVYQMADLSEIQSVIASGSSPAVLTNDDYEVAEDALSSVLSHELIAELTGTTTAYSASQTALNYSSLYDSNGIYIGGTYEDVTLSDDEVWPFEKVPKFNLLVQAGYYTAVTPVGTENPATEGWYEYDSSTDTYALSTDGTVDPNKTYYSYTAPVTVQGVYYVSSTGKYITDLDEFKALVLGTYTSSIDTKNDILTDRTYSRTRTVKQYKAGYDFDFIYSDDESYADKVLAWNKKWEARWPDIASPQEAFDEDAVSDDMTYLDYEDIENETEVDPQIKYVDAGWYLEDNFALPVFNTKDIILYDDGTTATLAQNVWHHNKEVSDQYTLASAYDNGKLYFGNSYEADLPSYFGANGQVKVYKGVYINQAQFKSDTSYAYALGGELSLALNMQKVYYYEQYNWDVWTRDIRRIRWTELTPASSNWLGHLRITYNSGKLTKYTSNLNSGVESVCDPYYVGSPSEGIRFAWPVWAHSATRITYPVVMTKTEMVSADEVLVVEQVETADLTNTNRIYWDRDDTDKSQKLFKIKNDLMVPEESDTGYATFSLTPVQGAFLYYAPRINNSEGKDITSSAGYFIPGIQYGDATSQQGNMYKGSNLPSLKLTWTLVKYSYVLSAQESFSNTNKDVNHYFYTNCTAKLNNLTVELGQKDYVNLTQPLIVKFPNYDLELTFHADTQITDTAYLVNAIYYDTLFSVIETAAGGVAQNVVIPVIVTLNYPNNTAKFIKLSDYSLVSSDGDKTVISDGTTQITYSISAQSITSPSKGVDVSVDNKNTYHKVTVEGNTQTSAAAYLKAVYDGTINGNVVTFTWGGDTYTWDFSQVHGDEGISVLSTDIRTPDKTKVIGRIRPEGQYQLLRQQWNSTVEVENFWWIDSKHILELNQYELVLKRNTSELDDWNGERFEEVYKVQKDKVLPTNIIRYFVTNVYHSEQTALFVTLQEDLGQILVTFYNPRKAFEAIGTQYIKINCKDIGQELNNVTISAGTAYFNTYNPITAAQVLSKAEWSNTIVDNWLILGCHLSNNYDQWALVINLDTFTLTKVIQGYGYVGLQGQLTGGQIPNDYFDVNKGFNSTVQPLSVLISNDELDTSDLDKYCEVSDLSTLNKIDAKVVGTSEQQWYIQQKLYGVVSHLTFESGSFIKQLLPITNNFTTMYKSPSLVVSVLRDTLIQAQPFAGIFSFPEGADIAWYALMVAAGYPTIFNVAPRFMQLVYLQQSIGQYAYVHYNSSKSLPEQEVGNDNKDSGINDKKNRQTSPVLSSTFTFDKQKITQQAQLESSTTTQLLFTLMIACSDALVYLDKKQSVNEEQNQTATSDEGKKYLPNVLNNVEGMLSNAILSQSKTDSGCTSVVSGIKSLDMFYSTSDQQHVYAGPGFVEHQLVADCIAQSSTDTQLEGKVIQLFMNIKSLTEAQAAATMALTQALIDFLDKQAENNSGAMVCGSTFGPAIAVALNASAYAMKCILLVQQIAFEEIGKILDVLTARGITANISDQVSRHALSVEGTHKYGEKNEVFMWPCWGIQSNQIKYTDEEVCSGIKNYPWVVSLASAKYWTEPVWNGTSFLFGWSTPETSSIELGDRSIVKAGNYVSDEAKTAFTGSGILPFYVAGCYGKAAERTLPDDMACVEGVKRFLPNEAFKNENIGVSDPAFASSMQQDYIIDKSWDLSQYCTYGMQQWIAVKDTKVIDCPPSNLIVTDSFCGIACPYTAVEVKRGIEKAYMRPWAVTPNTLAFNCTGYNSILDNKLYHAFDGISYRLVNLVGSPGLNKNRQSFWYAFQLNDRFKRSNKVPANEIQGNFESEPVQAVSSIDKLWSLMTIAAKEKGLEAGTIGEDKDLIRWAIPVFTEHVSTLPAAVKTLTAMSLGVVEGVTSLCVDLANNQTAYKAPLSVDFTIGKNVYRATEEYICSVQTQDGIDVVTDLIPSLGLTYIGATPAEAFFYSKSTRCYYSFSGSSLTKLDMMERFRDIQKGYWDFVNQEVIMPCLMTYKRLNPDIEDTDTETDNIIVPMLSKGQVSGELPPPITTIFNDRSWYKCVSLPCGFAYQGPNRVIINRSIFVEYMERSLKNNLGKWSKMNREKYVTKREYPDTYTDIMTDVQGVDGWTYNPFVLVTSPLGTDEDTDNLFEWNITFCWPIEMDLIYGVDNYAVVNIMAETMTPGGKQRSRPTHVFLTKELFTRNGNYGYYNFRFQSKNGAGNRERLHIWSDQYIAISKLDCEIKQVTSRRHEQLTQQIDVQKLKEL